MRGSLSSPTNTVPIILVLICTFIDILGFSLLIPVLPFLLTNEFKLSDDAAATWFGILMGSYSASELLGTIFIGPLSDRYGRRPIVLISIFGSGVGFIAQGLSPNVYWLLGFRVFSGLFGSTPPVAQSYITDLTSPLERPKYMGFLAAAMGFAFLFGPAIGAGLSEFSLRTPYYVATGVSVLAFTISIWKLPESKQFRVSKEEIELKKLGVDSNPKDDDLEEKIDKVLPESKIPKEENSENSDTNSSSASLTNKAPEVSLSLYWLLITTGSLAMLAFQAWQTVFPIMARVRFGYGAREVGFIITANATLFVLSNALIYGPIVKSRGVLFTASFGMLLMTGGLIVIGLVPLYNHIIPLLVGAFFAVIGFSFCHPSVSSLLSVMCKPKETGKWLSLASGGKTVSRIVGPVSLGLLVNISDYLPFFIAAGVSFLGFILFIIISYCLKDYQKYQKEERELVEFKKLIRPYFTTNPEDLKKEDVELTEKEKEAGIDMGLFIARLFRSGNYTEWTEHNEVIKNLIRDIFPPMPKEEGPEKRKLLYNMVSHIHKWGGEWHDQQQVMSIGEIQ